MRKAPGNGTPLCFLLGIWFGGSVFMSAVAIYNFSGIPHMFERNPRLAEEAGFEPQDEARRTSLLWAHSSELNRVYFEYWGKAQLALGSLALLAALVFRQGAAPFLLVLVALALSVYMSFSLVPEISERGRSFDFVPRDTESVEYQEFQKLHSQSIFVDLVRLGVVALAAGVVMFRARLRPGEAPLP